MKTTANHVFKIKRAKVLSHFRVTFPNLLYLPWKLSYLNQSFEWQNFEFKY